MPPLVLRFQPVRLSLLEHLWFAGDERFSALVASAQVDAHTSPEWGMFHKLIRLGDAMEIAKLAKSAPSELRFIHHKMCAGFLSQLRRNKQTQSVRMHSKA